ncbi:hypothetical protein MMC34_008555 [Xylographa carneopallida]|nr:hypothetical protein [Xylographa carneopallida]
MNQGVLSGILRWSLSQGDGLQPNEDVQPMSEEDAAFLQEAFESCTIDEAQRMRLIANTLSLPETEAGLREATGRSTEWIDGLQQVAKGVSEGDSVRISAEMNKASKPKRPNLSNSTATTAQQRPPTERPQPAVDPASIDYAQLLSEVVQRKEGALDELDDRVLTLDNSADFFTVGGFPPLLAALRSTHPSIRWRAAQALATICQNNPRCQKYAYETDALTALLHMLTAIPATAAASDEWQCVTKALYALSSLLRSETEQFVAPFVRAGGVEQLVALMLQPELPARPAAKCMALLRLLARDEEVGEVGDKLGWWQGVKRWVGSDDINAREECMRLLETGSRQATCKVAMRREAGLLDAVKRRVEECERMQGEDREMCEEELQKGKQVLHNLS